MTPEQLEKAEGFIKTWDADWGLYTDHVATTRGVARNDALLFIVALQIASMRDEFVRAQKHPEFKEDCKHCVEEKRIKDITVRYMEKVIGFIETDTAPDDWKPV